MRIEAEENRPFEEPMSEEAVLEFPYKHSTGDVIGRFLAGLKNQKKIWGQECEGQGVVVPPVGYSETNGSPGGRWVEVADRGVVTAVAKVHHPKEGVHPFFEPFAFVLVQLDGADTAMPHVVREELGELTVGTHVEAVWKPDEERIGSLRDIDSFRVIS